MLAELKTNNITQIAAIRLLISFPLLLSAGMLRTQIYRFLILFFSSIDSQAKYLQTVIFSLIE